MLGGSMRMVELNEVGPEDATILANLMELYCHELSPYFGLRIGNDGRYGYPALPLYWREPERRFAYFIRAEGELAGFALATRGCPVTTDPEHLDVAEFFVLRALRQSGVGERAASLLWTRLPGHWVVRAAECNQAAVRFWQKAVHRHSRGDFGEGRTAVQGVPWVVYELDT